MKESYAQIAGEKLEKSFNFIGKTIPKKWFREMEERKIFLAGEKIIAAIKGHIESGRIPLRGDRSTYSGISLTNAAITHVRNGLIGLTNQRVIFYMPKILGRYEFEYYDIDQISSIQFTKGLFSGRIQVTAFNDCKIIKHVKNDEAKTITEMIQKAVQKVKNRKHVVHLPKTKKPDEDDVLKILKLRYAKGEITKKQFEKMKKDLEE